MDQGKIIRLCVVGLPVGLILIGAGSVLMTHVFDVEDRGGDESSRKQRAAAGIMRKDIDRDDLTRYVRVLAGDIGERHLGAPERLRAAAYWIESTLGPSNMGYVVEREKYESGGSEVWNVVADLPGGAKAGEMVVIGAHYDTVPGCPGANDNGTGVAALLSLAQSFAGTRPERTLRFVAFVNEEPPHFQTDSMGSVVHAQNLQRQGARVTAMLSLETIGFYSDALGSQKTPPGLPADRFPTAGNFLALVGNPGSRALIETAGTAWQQAGVALAAVPVVLPESIEGVGWSDHWSFWRAGYPAMMATDTAPYRYAHYHRPTDTPDQIDYGRFTEAVKGLRAIVAAWAGGL